MVSQEGIDQGTVAFFQGIRRPWSDRLMEAVSFTGEWQFLTVVVMAGIFLFLVQRRYRAAVILGLTAVTGLLISETTKHLVERPRPSFHSDELSYSFPSGHSLNTVSIYGTLALLTARRLKERWAALLVVGIAGFWVLLVGVSRMYLGWHFPTDVLGGWMAGWALALTAYWMDDLGTRPHLQKPLGL